MSGHVRGCGVGAGLVGGAAAVALTLGLGGAHADTVDQLAGIAAAGGSSDSTDLLIIASTNFLDAKDVYTGIDTADLSDTLLSAVEGLHRYPSILDRVVDIVEGRLEPAESTILAHTGSMSSLIDQLFFAPLNQQWVDVSESLLDATHAFDTAVADGSVVDAMSAEFQILGLTFSDVIPTMFVSIPVVMVAGLFGDATALAAPDFFDFSV